ncbi:MAG: sigma-54 dependent transcriptional regulator [bacterium]
MIVRVLLVMADSSLKKRVRAMLDQADILVSTPRKSGEFWRYLATETFDLLLVDEVTLPKPAGESIGAVRNLPERPDVVVFREDEDSHEGAALLAAGVLAVMQTGLPDAMIGEALVTLVERCREEGLRRLQAADEQNGPALRDIFSKGPIMQSIIEISRRVAITDTTILLLGETGVGKEWLARAIHTEGPRSSGPFIALNCSAIPEMLLESELFGHEEGAFTGAHRAHRGHFELAHHGTIFLDEIAEMPLHLQAKLLRVLQERRIKRVGGEHEIETDVRVMAATNRDLELEMEAKRFRPDLYYRIGVVTITLPPLRDRREDIAEFVRDQLARFQLKIGRHLTGLEPEAMEALIEYDWPGNVRELINVIERAVLLCRSNKIHLGDLPEVVANRGVRPFASPMGGAPPAAKTIPPRLLEIPLKQAREEMIAAFEGSYLTGLLQRTEGRIGATARKAGITTRALYDKMKRYGLKKESFKV